MLNEEQKKHFQSISKNQASPTQMPTLLGLLEDSISYLFVIGFMAAVGMLIGFFLAERLGEEATAGVLGAAIGGGVGLMAVIGYIAYTFYKAYKARALNMAMHKTDVDSKP